MEDPPDGDLRVVQQHGVHLERGTRRRPAEEGDVPTLADHLQGLFPQLRQADGLDHPVSPPTFGRPLPHGQGGVYPLGGLYRLLGPQLFSDSETVVTLVDGDHPGPALRSQADEHQPDLARPDDRHGVAHGDGRAHDAVHGAGEGFQERGPAVLHALGDLVEVLLDYAGRYRDKLGEGAVEEGQVLAHRLIPDLAVVATVARRRVCRHHPHAGSPHPDAFADRLDGSPELVAEGGGDLLDQGRVATPVRLHVGAAGERRPYAHQDLARPRLRLRHVFHPHIARFVEHRCPHGNPPPASSSVPRTATAARQV